MASPRSAPKQAAAAAAAAAGSAEAGCDLEAQSRSTTPTHLSDGSSAGNSSNEWIAWDTSSDPELAVSEQRADAPKSWRTRRGACCVSCCSLSLLLVTLLVVLLRPREPEWQVQKLIVPPAALSSCIQAITQPSGENVSIGIDALVDFSNPNYLGAEAGEGRFAVTWEGQELASVTTEAGWAPARAHSQVTAHSASLITPELGKLLMQSLPGSGFRMQVNVKGELTATVRALLGLRVRVSLECTVDASVLLIMSEPDKLVTGHRCSYGVRL